MKLANEETFGPVAPFFKFKTEQEVIELANNTEFGCDWGVVRNQFYLHRCL